MRNYRPDRRAAIAVLLAFAVLVAAVLDATVKRTASLERAVESAPAPAGAVSSAWYCPLTPAARNNPQQGLVTVLNPTDRALTAEVTFYPTTGQPVTTALAVPANAVSSTRPGDVVDSPYAAALVQVDGGGVAVDHSIQLPQGTSTARCSTSASATWHVPDGTTVSGAALLLAIFNPFLEDAVADMDFATNDGRTSPVELQGVVIPARSVVVVDLSERIRRREWIASTISARSGRIVVDQAQINGYDGTPGVGLTPAVPVAEDWHFPTVTAANDIHDRISFSNPSDVEAVVDAQVRINADRLETFPLHVPPHGRAVLDLWSSDRIPKDGRFSVHVISTNGVAVAAAKTTTAAPPSPFSGAFLYAGATAPAERWAFPKSAAAPGPEQWLSIVNSGPRRATVRIDAVSGGTKTAVAQGVFVEPGQRIEVQLTQPVAGLESAGLTVEADEPVIVGRELRRPSGPLVESLAVPLG